MSKVEIFVVMFVVGIVVFCAMIERNLSRPCAVYETRRVGDKWVGRNCNVFGCDDREFVPAHDERFCVSK
jgi:hypothetical protein